MKILKLALLCFITFTSIPGIFAKETSQEMFFKAVDDNDPFKVKKIIELKGIDINKINPKTGKTALNTVLLKIFDYSSKRYLWLLPLLVTIKTALISKGALVSGATYGIGYAAMGSTKKSGIIASIKKAVMQGEWRSEEDMRRKLKIEALSSFAVLLIAGTLATTSGFLTHKLRTRLENAQKVAYLLLSSPRIKIDSKMDDLRKQVFPDYEMELISLKMKEAKSLN